MPPCCFRSWSQTSSTAWPRSGTTAAGGTPPANRPSAGGGKVKETASWQMAEGDATVLPPLIVADLFDRVDD